MKTNNMKVREITTEAEIDYKTSFLKWAGVVMGRCFFGIYLYYEVQWQYEKTMDALAESFAEGF